MFRHADVATEFQTLLRRFAISSTVIESVLDQLEEVRQDKGHARPDDLKKREQTLSLLNERRRRLYEMREDGTYDADTFRDRLVSVEAEIAALTTSGNAPDLASVDPAALRQSARWFLEHLALIWEKLPDASRSRFETIAFPHGIPYDPRMGLRTTVPGPILALSAAHSTSKSNEVHLEGISSNQLCAYFEELIAFYHEMKNIIPEQAGVDAAA
jgi:hypothetical protein